MLFYQAATVACCHPLAGSNLLRAGDIRLVATTCNKSDEVVNLVTEDANNLSQICQTTVNKQCERILIST